jgi:hypothetical protein
MSLVNQGTTRRERDEYKSFVFSVSSDRYRQKVVRRERGVGAENNLSGLFTQIQNPINGTHTDKFFFILR